MERVINLKKTNRTIAWFSDQKLVAHGCVVYQVESIHELRNVPEIDLFLFDAGFFKMFHLEEIKPYSPVLIWIDPHGTQHPIDWWGELMAVSQTLYPSHRLIRDNFADTLSVILTSQSCNC